MKIKITHIHQSKLLRNVAVLFSGVAAAQIITFACSPIVTRIYGPEAFGLTGTLLSLASLLAPIITFSYPTAITLPEENSEAKRIVIISVLISTLISFISCIFIVIFKIDLSKLLGIKTNSDYLLLVPVMLFFLACLEISQQCTIRKQDFKIISRVVVSNSLSINFCKIVSGHFYPSAITLITLSIIANMHQTMMYIQKQVGFRKLFSEIRSHFDQKSLLNIAVKYKDFPLYRMPQILMLAISQNFPLLILASFSGMVSAGHYGLARTVMVVPVMLLGNIAGSVFYPRINQAVLHNENIEIFLKKATFFVAIFSLLPFTLLYLYSPWIFSTTFGYQWKGAGNYASWLSIFFYFSMLTKPAFAAVAPFRIQKNMFYYELGSMTLKLTVFLIGLVYFKSDEKAIMLYSLFGAASYLYITFWIIQKSKSINCVENNLPIKV